MVKFMHVENLDVYQKFRDLHLDICDLNSTEWKRH